jgi:hypothetical protein
MSAQQICSNACTRILFIARGPRQPACIFETKTGREFSTRSSQKKRERALLKQESTADSTLVPHMRMNCPRETLAKGISKSFAAFGP